MTASAAAAHPPASGPGRAYGRNRLLHRSGWRHWLRHPWQAVLAVGGIAMGVAMVTAVDLASQSARVSYLASAETLAGRATHHVTGLTADLPDSLYVRLRLAGLRDAAGCPPPMSPVLEGRVELTGGRQGRFRLVGVDPFSSRELGAFGLVDAGAPQSGEGLTSLLSRPGTVLLSSRTAKRLGISAGDTLELDVPAGGVADPGVTGERNRARIFVLGFLEPRNRFAETVVDDLMLGDLSTVQEILGKIGVLSRIEMDLSGTGSQGNPEAALVEKVRTMLPTDAWLAAANARARTLDAMTRAFRINLTALSLLALLVGAFLIYNTMAFSVAQRWNLLGILRSLGATPADIARLVCREAALLSLAGTAAGIGAGILLGRGLVALVARTINDLYFAAQVTGLRIEPAILLKGALLGLGMGLLASLGPAWQASRIRPRALLTRSAQETRLRERLPMLGLFGLGFALLAALLAWLPGGGLIAGFASLACAVFAWSLWTPSLLSLVSGAAATALRRLTDATSARKPGAAAVLARMAVRGVGASLSRTGVAAAALMTALSVTVAMGVMVDSFRKAVQDWLQAVLVADVYVSPPRDGSGRMQGRLDPAWAARAAKVPGVAGVTTYLSASVPLDDSAGAGQAALLALDMDPRSRRAFGFLDGDPSTAWEAFHRSPDCAVLVSEPFAYRRGLRAGSILELPTGRGTQAFRVAGVFADYGSDQGMVVLDRSCFEIHWQARGITSLAFFAEKGADPDLLGRRLGELPGSAEVEIHPTRSLREASLEIFDRTFAITSVLRLAAVLVALVGLVGALAALELERAPETALLRALGFTPGQTWGLATVQAAFLGLATGLLSVPLGLAQADLLIHVINRRSFGWSMPMQVDPWICLQALGLGLAAGLLAAILPAWKASRAVTARALREE
jgi:putative ABC transport system permease protein